MSGRRNRGDDQVIGCIAMGLLCLIAMPLVGLYLMSRKGDSTAQAIGVILLVVGIILWIAVAAHSG